MDDCIQGVMLRCMHVPGITAVGPIVTEKTDLNQKNLTNFLDHEIQIKVKHG